MKKEMISSAITEIIYANINDYLKNKNVKPYIVDISIGDDYGGKMYSKMKKNTIEKETSIKFESIHFDNISKEDLKEYIKKLNKDKKVTGILLQLPLPPNLAGDEREILDLIDKDKDVDGLTSYQAGLLSVGEECLAPCTALGIVTLLKYYNISLAGKKVAIINRSNIVGKPLFNLLLRENSTPTLCHSKTNDLRNITKNSDIIIAALNKQEYIDSTFISEGAIVVDVGVHKNKDGKTVGDINFKDTLGKVSLITPPIGAVGPMTICMLAFNSVKAIYGNAVNEIIKF